METSEKAWEFSKVRETGCKAIEGRKKAFTIPKGTRHTAEARQREPCCRYGDNRIGQGRRVNGDRVREELKRERKLPIKAGMTVKV